MIIYHHHQEDIVLIEINHQIQRMIIILVHLIVNLYKENIIQDQDLHPHQDMDQQEDLHDLLTEEEEEDHHLHHHVDTMIVKMIIILVHLVVVLHQKEEIIQDLHLHHQNVDQ